MHTPPAPAAAFINWAGLITAARLGEAAETQAAWVCMCVMSLHQLALTCDVYAIAVGVQPALKTSLPTPSAYLHTAQVGLEGLAVRLGRGRVVASSLLAQTR